jgi:predicted methyltransferase
MAILSHYQTTRLLTARHKGLPFVEVSLDLGLSHVQISLSECGVELPDGHIVNWETIKLIDKSTSGCYQIFDGLTQKIQIFSEQTGLLYSLMPTESAPTMLISGLPMHRIKDTNPYQDTVSKVANLEPVIGNVLDTATGLGYTSIQCATTAEKVITIELEPAAIEIARINPWSRELFNNPTIEQIIGDSLIIIEGFADEHFHRILHDPPTSQLAGDLYSQSFYKQLFRVLRPGGKLFHYIGDLNSRSGSSVATGATNRLRSSGFSRVERRPQSFGLLAYK